MNGSMFIGTWWALVPPLLAILLAFVTKEVYSSLFIGSAVGVLLYTGFHPWDAFTSFFEILRNSMNINILIFDILLGMVVVLMAKSGGSAAYGKWAGTKIKTKRSALLATMGLGVLIFVDDYFNCLTVGSVMRPVTDSHKVSRAKLAYIIDSTAAPICIIAPISSWAAAVNSYVPADAGISGFQLFLRTIPYNLYAILTIAMVFYICYTGFDFGQMKLHEDNAAKGDLFTTGGEEFEQVSEQEVNPNGKVIDLVLPVAVLIVSAIGAMVYTGFLGGADAAYDTLLEIQQLLQNGTTGLDALLAAVNNRVRFDAAQTLSAPEQAQARSNIGAVAASDVGDTDTDFVAVFEGALV